MRDYKVFEGRTDKEILEEAINYLEDSQFSFAVFTDLIKKWAEQQLTDSH